MRDRYEAHGVVLTGCYFICTACSLMKPASDFGLRKLSDGLIRNQPQCTLCRSLRKHEKVRKNDR